MTEEKTLNDYTPEQIESARQSVARRLEWQRRYDETHKERKAQYQQEHLDKQREAVRKCDHKHRAKKKEYMVQYYQENKCTIKKSATQHYQEHKDDKKVYNAQHYQENRDKILRRSAQHYQEKKHEILEHQHQYNLEHKDDKKAYDAQHYREIQEEHRQHMHQYYQKNREKILEYMHQYKLDHPQVQHNNRTKRLGADGTFTPEEWTHKLEEYDNKCAYCNTKTEDTPERFLTVDHATPLTRVGTNYIDNLVPACFQCNMEKSTMTSEEFFESIDADKEEGVLVRRYISEHPEEAVQLFEKYKIGFQEEVQSNDSQEK